MTAFAQHVLCRVPCKISVHTSANVTRNYIVDRSDEHFEVKLKAPTVEGNANKELLRFLSNHLDLHHRDNAVKGGTIFQGKLIAVYFMDEQTLRGGFNLSEAK